MRRRLIAALSAAVAAAALALPATAQASISTPAKVCAANAITLPGGLCGVRVAGARSAAEPDLSGLEDIGTANIINSSHLGYGITDQPTTSDGRQANHLYMWTISAANWSTQRWTIWLDKSAGTYTFQSAYGGASGGLAYGCINVPEFTKKSGVQLIVYSCSGVPDNERFFASSGTSSSLQANYSPYPLIGIGSNFPGNGAWVISWTGAKNSNTLWSLYSA
jgi:hypothetical protein